MLQYDAAAHRDSAAGNSLFPGNCYLTASYLTAGEPNHVTDRTVLL